MRRFWLASSSNENWSQSHSREVIYPVIAAIWLIAVAFGLGFLMRYANAPGEQGNVVATWPSDSQVQRSGSRPTLMVFAHPRCPCTAATLDELSWIMTRCRDQVDCHVLFFHPRDEGPEWARTGNWRAADSIDGVNVLLDPQSQTASLFGVRTSGHAILYDRNGQLAFEGGITPSRGHRGENVGRTALLSVIRGASSDSRASSTEASVNSTCVFGCPLHSSEAGPDDRPIHGER